MLWLKNLVFKKRHALVQYPSFLYLLKYHTRFLLRRNDTALGRREIRLLAALEVTVALEQLYFFFVLILVFLCPFPAPGGAGVPFNASLFCR